MSSKRVWIVALALTLAPTGCKTRSNTVEQQQSNSTNAVPVPATPGTDTNPHMPNPTGTRPGTPMTVTTIEPSGTGTVGAGVLDAGVSAGSAGAAARAGKAPRRTKGAAGQQPSGALQGTEPAPRDDGSAAPAERDRPDEGTAPRQRSDQGAPAEGGSRPKAAGSATK